MIFDFRRPPELPPQLQWEYAHEPALMEWTIRARNYNTFVANNIFIFLSVFMLAPSYGVYAGERDTVSGVVFYFLCMLVSSMMTHQRMNLAYRFTQSGLEYCKWKDFPQWMLTFLNWFSGIAAVICVSLASIDPTFLIGALIGPGGIGLVYLIKVNSKDYQALHTEFHHHAFKWTEMTQLAIAKNREVVDLQYSVSRKESEFMIHWNLNIFCKRREKHKVADFIKQYLPPEVPRIVAKVNVPLSTD